MTLEEILGCPKIIERKRKPPFRIENRHYRMNIDLACPSNDKLSFSTFVRRLVDFPEDFTVGLKLNGPSEIMEYDVVILRCQGPHGGQSQSQAADDLHNSYHIHEYTEEDLLRRRKKASYKGKAEFSSYEEAVVQFLERCCITDPNGIFDDEREMIIQVKMNLDNLEGKGADGIEY